MLTVTVDINIGAVHEQIVGVCHFDITECYITAMPQSLGSIRYTDISQRKTVHLAEHLGRVDQRIAHLKITGIP